MCIIHGLDDENEVEESYFVEQCRGWDTITSHWYPEDQLVVQIGICNFIYFEEEPRVNRYYGDRMRDLQDEALNWILTNIRNKDLDVNWFGLRVKLSNIEVYRETVRTYDRA
jgi:hypothetical protein